MRTGGWVSSTRSESYGGKKGSLPMIRPFPGGVVMWQFLIGAAVALLLSAAPARADFGITPGSYSASMSSGQAGGHGDLSISFAVNSHSDPDLGSLPDEDTKSLVIDLPPGLVGNPQAVPKCNASYLAANRYCPRDTQVGVIQYTLAGLPFHFIAPIYNMEPSGGRVAELAFENQFITPVQIHILASVRTGGDYGVRTEIPRLPGNLKVLTSDVTIWGVPAASSHDGDRGAAGFDPNGCLTPATEFGPTGLLCPSSVQPKPFLSNPTQCASTNAVSLTVDSYQHPGAFISPLMSVPQQMSGCDLLTFDPSLSLKPDAPRAGAPSGYSVDLHIPQSDSLIAPAVAQVKRVVVTLPEGVTVSPSAADGLAGCTDAEIGLHSPADPTCPDASKIGTVTIMSPLLPEPIDGSVYQGTQTPGHLLRIFLFAKGSGVSVKLPGSVDLNQTTGQITTTFDNNPQLPFTDFVLKFKGGPRAPLANPRTCGVKTTTATLTSWAGQTVNTSSSFVISRDGAGAPCKPYGFKPVFGAQSTSPVAGHNSVFTLYFARSDDDQEFDRVTTELPRGLLAKIANVPLCDVTSAAMGMCSASSRIGSVVTSAGPGTHPFFLSGSAYITSRYKGQPFGLSIVVPAKAGPLDLGNVVVRASIEVRNDGSLRIVSDKFPTILQGIPLQVRSVQVTVDRDKFILNPTNCDPMRVEAAITSLQGAVARAASRFQVGDCAALRFNPKLTLSVGRKGHTRKHASAPLIATLTQAPHQAALKTAKVMLPLTLNALLPVVNNACTLTEFRAGHCAKARAGSAVASTPLLKRPLRGSVYFVKTSIPGALPNLVVALRGQVDIDLTAKVTIPSDNRLGTVFKAIPDVPLSKFTLRIVDGARGPIGVATDLCSEKARRATATVDLRGQNGSAITRSQRLIIHGCGKRAVR